MSLNRALQRTDSIPLPAALPAVGLILVLSVLPQAAVAGDSPPPAPSPSPAPVPATGRSTCWDAKGIKIACAGTGQDGDLRKDVKWPNPRFTDNGNGTVTDNLTGLIWLQNPGCPSPDPGVLGFPKSDWETALSEVAKLAVGSCGLTDGSKAGQWRVPNVLELQSLIDYGFADPALSNAAGTSQWKEGDPFSGVQANFYWSSTRRILSLNAWFVDLSSGFSDNYSKTLTYFVWPVRGGDSPSPAPVPATGQSTCSDAKGKKIACAGTGQDGDLRKGVKWPNPRFTDNGDGTVTDNLTRLIWLQNPGCPIPETGTLGFPESDWETALSAVAKLASGSCGLTDGSKAGQWRVPNVLELQSLIDYEFVLPALSNAAGTAQWKKVDAFSGVQMDYYWSSTPTAADDPAEVPLAWWVDLEFGVVSSDSPTTTNLVWPVRDGQ